MQRFVLAVAGASVLAGGCDPGVNTGGGTTGRKDQKSKPSPSLVGTWKSTAMINGSKATATSRVGEDGTCVTEFKVSGRTCVAKGTYRIDGKKYHYTLTSWSCGRHPLLNQTAVQDITEWTDTRFVMRGIDGETETWTRAE